MYDDGRFYAQIDSNTGYRTKSMLTMPILDSRGGTLAVMQFLNKNGGGVFTREDFDMLHALCAQTSMAIQVTRAYVLSYFLLPTQSQFGASVSLIR